MTLLDASMRWMDALWDDDARLLWSVDRSRHMTRETAWYAFGLLQEGRADRARAALRAVTAAQFDAPGADFDGTFRRSPEEADPPSDATMWFHYDPNWRQFIGTVFALICDRYAAEIGPEIEDALRASIGRAVVTEGDERVAPTYANIALMKAWLDAWSGRTDVAERFAAAIARHFDSHSAFLEYNSPTYYGIDLYALALWRLEPALAEHGRRIADALWRDIAATYHAGMRTVCGPFDRCYGLDMTTHATPLGLWIWSVVGHDLAPFPNNERRFSHPHDFCFAPCVAAFDAEVPADVVPALERFDGERTVERIISDDPSRVVTAWLSDDVMFGGWDGPTSGIGYLQHRHATAHWRRADGTTGWLAVPPETNVRARATSGRLAITTDATPLPLQRDRDDAAGPTVQRAPGGYRVTAIA